MESGSGPHPPESAVDVRRIGPGQIAALQPLWESLHRHHAEVAPALEALGPIRSGEESWAVRRALYEEWLAEPNAFALLAEAGGRAVGYAVVHMRGPEESWATGDRIAELETLTVLPGFRGRGIGRALVDRVQRELEELGVRHLAVSVIASNAGAVRFYRRLGLMPFLVSFIGPLPLEPPEAL